MGLMMSLSIRSKRGSRSRWRRFCLPSCQEVVESDDVSAFAEKSVTQVRSQKPGPARNKDVLVFAILHEERSFRPTKRVSRYITLFVQR